MKPLTLETVYEAVLASHTCVEDPSNEELERHKDHAYHNVSSIGAEVVKFTVSNGRDIQLVSISQQPGQRHTLTGAIHQRLPGYVERLSDTPRRYAVDGLKFDSGRKIMSTDIPVILALAYWDWIPE